MPSENPYNMYKYGQAPQLAPTCVEDISHDHGFNLATDSLAISAQKVTTSDVIRRCNNNNNKSNNNNNDNNNNKNNNNNNNHHHHHNRHHQQHEA